jgi:hypothetical protein
MTHLAQATDLTVTTAPFFDPGHGRKNIVLSEGLTVLELVKKAMPHLQPSAYKNLRVALVSQNGTAIMLQEYWHCIMPKAGARVLIRLIPGKDALRSILIAVVSIAAIALGQAWAVALIPTAGIAQSVLAVAFSAGLNIIGNLLINALIPLPTSAGVDTKQRNVYAISGWRNSLRQDEPIPFPLGQHRYAPPFAAGSYTEIVGDDQYIRGSFCFGYGPLEISDLKLGDIPLSEYKDVELEVREGRSDDLPLSLYPQQVLEDPASIELLRPLPRDDAGEVVKAVTAGITTEDIAGGIETPIKRFTATDTKDASVIIAMPSGLFRITGGGSVQNQTVEVRIRQRAEGAQDWIDVETLTIIAAKRETFFRQYTWELPFRGRWEIEVTRMTVESVETQVSDRTTLAAIQSIRPEYPININKPVALVALRIRATHQLNGSLGNLNAIVQRYGKIYDADTSSWIEGLSRNPATAYLAALTGPASAFPVPESEIDFDQIADWYAWCTEKGLKYDHVHERSETLRDMLSAICAAGRASPRHDGLKWGVVIDRVETSVIDHINPRNSSDFQWHRSYFEPPHALRVTFLDETNDYNQAERIIRWPDYTGTITLTEAMPLQGKTDPNEIWIEARRRMYELIHRPDTFTAIQSGAARTATRGDLVMGSFDVLDKAQTATRVKSVRDGLIEVDELITIHAGVDYGIRFRKFDDPEDTIGVSHVIAVTGAQNETRLLRALNSHVTPDVGMLVHFGPMATESLAFKVRGIESGENFSSVLNLVAAAPIIDELTDMEIPPLWNGRVGAPANVTFGAPTQPKFTSILHGISGTGKADTIEVLVSPGTGSAAVIKSYRIEHKLSVEAEWASQTVNAGDGGANITDYVSGDDVEIRAISIAEAGTESIPSAIVSLIVGSSDAIIPTALDDNSITTFGSLGFAQILVGTTSDPATTQIQFYRVPAGMELNRDTHSVGETILSAPLTTLVYVDGDATRSNLLTNGSFEDGSIWTLDPSWAIAGEQANHTAGSAGGLEQPLSLVAGNNYRLAFTVGNRTAGSILPRLRGATDASGASQTTNDIFYDSIEAVAGNNAFGLSADANFDGSIDDIVLFLETVSCVDQGDYDYYLEPQNEDNVAGPVSGPFNVQIV